MRLLTKLMRLRAALAEVIDELDDSPAEQAKVLEEAEILLTRSAKNRRSDKNEVMTLVPLNGAPAVPESWREHNRGTRSIASNQNRKVIATILEDYEPMPRVDVWMTAREIDPRLLDATQMKNLQQMVNRMVRVGQLTLKNGLLGMGA